MSSPTENPLDDGFTSITWDKPTQPPPTTLNPSPDLSSAAGGGGFQDVPTPALQVQDEVVPPDVLRAEHRGHSLDDATREGQGGIPAWGGKWMVVEVGNPVKEHEGTKEMYVSYGVRTRTNIATFPPTTAKNPITVRRRFQDFVFLRDHLTKNFPACVVPPIPDKHRMEYIKGDRFSPEFIEHRRIDLQHFADRIARHPTLSKCQLVADFLQSNQWTVAMHKHISSPPPDSQHSLMDNISDSFINAFTKVRKPDERFMEMKEGIDKFEDGMTGIERLVGKEKSRTEDLAQDYVDMAASYQGLGYLESGITEPLNRFAERLLDFSTLLKELDSQTVEPFLSHVHSLIAYSQAHKAVLKLRDEKQLDFEELSGALSGLVAERDRLAALNSGHTSAPVGLSTYLRDQVDKLRGTDDIHTRRERIRKMDGKIKELQDAVTTAHETATEFNDEILKEHNIFELDKQEEMKDLLGRYAEGQIAMYQKAIEDWNKVVPMLQRIKVEV